MSRDVAGLNFLGGAGSSSLRLGTANQILGMVSHQHLTPDHLGAPGRGHYTSIRVPVYYVSTACDYVSVMSVCPESPNSRHDNNINKILQQTEGVLTLTDF